MLVSLRKIDAHGFARTKTEQQDNYRNRDAYIENLRGKWEHLANRHLERHGLDVRIDRRSLQEQGIERPAQTHRGPTKSAAMFCEQDREARAAAVAEIDQLQAQIIDLDAKRAARAKGDAWAGQGDQLRADETPKAQDMAERTNDNDPFTGAEDYIETCTAEFERQAEAAQGWPDPFRPPLPQNENERQALKLWLAELEQQMNERGFVPADHAENSEEAKDRDSEPPPAANQNAREDALFVGSWDSLDPAKLPPLDLEQPADPFEERKREGFASFRPSEPQPGRYGALDGNEQEPLRPDGPIFGPETIAASDPAAIDRVVAEMQAAAAEPQAKEPASEATDGLQQAAEAEAPADPVATAPGFGRAASRFIDALAARFASFITYLSDLIAPPPKMTVQQVRDHLQAAGNLETLHAEAVAEQQQEHEAARIDDILRADQQQQQADLSLAQRFGRNATREANLGREHDRQPDKDRDYELE